MSRSGRGSLSNSRPPPSRVAREDLAQSIQEAVSGAVSHALAPVLQGLQASSSGATARSSPRPADDLTSDDEDFEPTTKKR